MSNNIPTDYFDISKNVEAFDEPTNTASASSSSSGFSMYMYAGLGILLVGGYFYISSLTSKKKKND